MSLYDTSSPYIHTLDMLPIYTLSIQPTPPCGAAVVARVGCMIDGGLIVRAVSAIKSNGLFLYGYHSHAK